MYGKETRTARSDADARTNLGIGARRHEADAGDAAEAACGEEAEEEIEGSLGLAAGSRTDATATLPDDRQRLEDQIEKLLRFVVPHIPECVDHVCWNEVLGACLEE